MPGSATYDAAGLADIDTCLQRFDDNARFIKNAITNFNKLGRNNQTQAVTKGRAKLLEKQWTEAQRQVTQIELLATPDDRNTLAYFKDSHSTQLEDQYLAAYDFFEEKIASLQTQSHVDGRGTGSSSIPGNGATNNGNAVFKLPTISVPPFSGIVTDWIAFRDLFTSLITSHVGLSNVHKLHYLLSVVTGDASKLIAHISLSDDNFEVAWQILKDHYENTRCIINAHLNKFFAIKAVTPNEATAGLKKLRASASESINALRALQRPVDQWNDILVFCLTQKLDKNSRREWEIHLGDDSDYPKLDKLTKFLDTRIRSLEAAASSQPSEKTPDSFGKKETSVAKVSRAHHGTATDACVFCSETHKITQCAKFKAKSVADRQKHAHQNYLCINCLAKGHVSADCRSTFSCFHCKRRHHSLLHDNRGERSRNTIPLPAQNNNAQASAAKTPSHSGSNADPAQAESSGVAHAHVATQGEVLHQSILLATAWVQIESEQGRQIQARALIDPGSDTSFISETLAQCLRLSREPTNAYVSSVGGKAASTVKSSAALLISAIQNPARVKLRVQALILPQITAYVPAKTALINAHVTKGLMLADPEPTSSASIELLLGADLYPDIMCEGLRKDPAHNLLFQNTVFGWIISGASSSPNSNAKSIHTHHATVLEVTSDLVKFFEVEEVPARKCLTPPEVRCNRHFEETHYRNSEGVYVVSLPFKTDPPVAIGDTKVRAHAAYRQLEQRLQRNPDLNKQYNAFLLDYLQANHMELFSEANKNAQTVYLPHHPVVKDSITTKLRVVFNASARSSNGSSLNDHLLPGPDLQTDLVSVILNWRMFRYVFTADIAQMFRQILIAPKDRSYQLILWRANPNEEVQRYQLNTVTYGTACAPFLAQRVLLQVAEDEGREFPLAVPILRGQRYMDDLMFGDDTRQGAIEKRTQVSLCLARAGFVLRKWASNDAPLLSGIDSTNHGLALSLPLQEGSKLKVLGLNWEPSSDSFRIIIQTPKWTIPTKRQILSLVARCFDPLGWLAPVVIVLKIIVQSLWRSKTDWDEPVPEPIVCEWRSFCEQLPSLNQVSIPRWTGSDKTSKIQIHGFCDASERAYAAVTYLLVQAPNASTQIHLMFAKTRVAPLKTLTIPRLELCAAVLLTRCVSALVEAIQAKVESINCWSDSSVVLCWIKKPPSNLKVFAAHRVAEIQAQMPQANWRHVPSGDNPADCASRGTSPGQFKDCALWWHGPQWLRSGPETWPEQTFLDDTPTELEIKAVTCSHVQVRNAEEDSIQRLSHDIPTWPRLLRVTAYIRRFTARCRRKSEQVYLDLALEPPEIRETETFWICRAQNEAFSSELAALAKHQPIPRNSKLKRLDPYLDEAGLIRVGGRLQQADLPMDQKHPVILSKHRISQLLTEHIHRKTLHGGKQLMLRVLRERYWVLRARDLVRSVQNKCVSCVRERAETREQLMANLPKARITRSRPFSHCGVDYAGPILVRDAAGRGRTSHKAYIALFICLATRAIHLELVHSYDSAAFVAAFQRFSARRGLPSAMYSDNGTTFQGAEKELRLAFKQVLREVDFRNILASDEVSWHFLPPAAPHFGGIWEAGVKSVKYHIKRILKGSTPTVEEFSTLLCNIEACLNSRPIAPLSDDLSSYDALTPGHFLVGTTLKSVPMPSTLHINENRLDRWQGMRQKLEQFWHIWSQDYVNTLQQRVKWQTREPNLQVGDVVLIRNKNLPPSKWELARVLECFPDRENLVRSVKVKTANSEYIRPIVKLCKLPVQSEPEPQSHESAAAAQLQFK